MSLFSWASKSPSESRRHCRRSRRVSDSDRNCAHATRPAPARSLVVTAGRVIQIVVRSRHGLHVVAREQTRPVTAAYLHEVIDPVAQRANALPTGYHRTQQQSAQVNTVAEAGVSSAHRMWAARCIRPNVRRWARILETDRCSVYRSRPMRAITSGPDSCRGNASAHSPSVRSGCLCAAQVALRHRRIVRFWPGDAREGV
jgi:hypothetical protein